MQAAMLVGCVCLPVAARAQPAPSFHGLGDLPGGEFRSSATAISADGGVVVGQSRSASGFEAFLWTPEGGMIGLGELPGGSFRSEAEAVSADGSVVVGSSISGVSGRSGIYEAFRWTAEDGMIGLGDLPGGGPDSRAYGVSADGSVVVGRSESADSGFTTEAFRWTQTEGMVGLGDLPGGHFESRANGVSPDGTLLVGQSVTAAGREAFRWTAEGGLVGLGSLGDIGGAVSDGTAVSADGTVLVGSSESTESYPHPEAFRWAPDGGMVGLGDLPGGPFRSKAYDVSADGSVVVGRSATSQSPGGAIEFEAFVWDTARGMRSLRGVLVDELGLDLTGWTPLDAFGISADGLTIAGEGLSPNGDLEAFVATLPEPATLSLLVVGGFAIRTGRHRSTRTDVARSP